ncbi:MAG: EAL domain-containing protein [Comamonadaceae bacterium]|nr:MAG: EAL domain-containing protein [Comamonadaceae bacterium]
MSAQPQPPAGRLPRTFNLTWPFIVIVLLQALMASGSIYVLSSVRAFVNGESQWTKGQKDAIHYLGQYARTGDARHYQRFQQAMRIPLADQEGRRLLEADTVDIAAARRAFAQGGNHDDDITGLILMLRYLRDFDIVRKPIEFWLTGDRYMQSLLALSDEIHAAVTAGAARPDAAQQWQQRIDAIDDGVTPVATAFSEAAGESSRRIVVWLLGLNLATAAWLIALTLAHTHRLQRQRKRVEDVLQGERESARATLAAIGDGVVTTDAQGLITYLNGAAEDMFALPLANAGGRPLAELMRFAAPAEAPGAAASTDAGDAAPLLRRVLQGGHALHDERTRQLLRPDGSTLPVTLVGSPLHHQGAAAGAVFVLHDVTQEQQYLEQLRWQATHDALTGLVNRREFERRLQSLLAHPGPASSLLYVDLDQFKIINDTCGHPAGDEMLRAICRLLQSGLREGDTLARLGGDEFGVLLAGCPPDTALQIAQDLRQAAQDLQVPWGERVLRTGLSIGLVHLDGRLDSLQEVLRVADMACYGAKERGRNTVHVHQPDDALLSRSADDMDWMQRLRDALDHGLFSLYAQEIAPLQAPPASASLSASQPTGRHVELLLRLHDPAGQPVSPAQFLPAAERLGLMPAIDRWVVDRALSELAQRRLTGSTPPIALCAINLSGTSVGDEGLLDYLRTQIAHHGVPPNLLCFEVTETAAIAHMPNAIRLIRELKQQGCHFSLDDFGSGMSSFAYLRQLPVDYLKIDGALVRDMVDDPANRAMVEMINHIGHVMGKQTIAEFAETPEIIAALRAMGVDSAQGYAIGRPQPFAMPRQEAPTAADAAGTSAPLAQRFAGTGLARDDRLAGG